MGSPGRKRPCPYLKERSFMRRPFLAYELTSVARKKAPKYPQLRERICEALEIGLSLDINWTEVDHLEVLRLALEKGLTTYDASCLYLARSLGVPLLTFDARLAAQAK